MHCIIIIDVYHSSVFFSIMSPAEGLHFSALVASIFHDDVIVFRKWPFYIRFNATVYTCVLRNGTGTFLLMSTVYIQRSRKIILQGGAEVARGHQHCTIPEINSEQISIIIKYQHS